MFDKLCLHLQKDVFDLKKYLTMLKYVQIHIYSESIFSVQNILDKLGNFSKALSKFRSEKQILTELKKRKIYGTIISVKDSPDEHVRGPIIISADPKAKCPYETPKMGSLLLSLITPSSVSE